MSERLHMPSLGERPSGSAEAVEQAEFDAKLWDAVNLVIEVDNLRTAAMKRRDAAETADASGAS